jgi:hypothetical protein
LYSVHAIASDDVWAVGFGGKGVFTMHWDGSGWSLVSAPSAGKDPILVSVDASAPDDVWAVGQTHPGFTYSFSEHWDGSAWTLVPTPNVPHGSFNALGSVAAIAPDDAWAFGENRAQGGSTDTPVALHWDGAQWNETTPPAGAESLGAAAASGPNDIWVLGTSLGVTATYHWNGARWTRVPLDPRDQAAAYQDIEIIGPNDVWVGGVRITDPRTWAAATVTEHWNGIRWTRVPNPRQPKGDYGELAAVGQDDVWGVGERYLHDSARYISGSKHWDGSAWTAVPTPQIDRSNILNDADALPDGQIWAVGTDLAFAGSTTLAMRICPAARH